MRPGRNSERQLRSGIVAVAWSYVVSRVLAVVNTGAGTIAGRYGHSRARAESLKAWSSRLSRYHLEVVGCCTTQGPAMAGRARGGRR